jgi:hypothetical protein
MPSEIDLVVPQLAPLHKLSPVISVSARYIAKRMDISNK